MLNSNVQVSFLVNKIFDPRKAKAFNTFSFSLFFKKVKFVLI